MALSIEWGQCCHLHFDRLASHPVAIDYFHTLHQLTVRRGAASDDDLSLVHLIAAEITRFWHLSDELIRYFTDSDTVCKFLLGRWLRRLDLKPLLDILYLLPVAKGYISRLELLVGLLELHALNRLRFKLYGGRLTWGHAWLFVAHGKWFQFTCL